MTKYEQEVKETGKLPAFSFPGLYPIFYLNDREDILCAECAAKNAEEVVNHSIYWEGPSMYCDECGEEIQSAYGDPEEES